MSIYPGFWISPIGDVVTFGEGAVLHIKDITLYPEKFGLTLADIKKIEAKYPDEPLIKYPEGKVRSELIRMVSERGWVRMRLYRHHLSATVFDLNHVIRLNIAKFCSDVVTGEIRKKVPKINWTFITPDTPIKISSTKGIGKTIERSMIGAAKDELVENRFEFLEILDQEAFARYGNL